MTDTARTLAECKALLADNTTGNISAQDMRDVVESIANPVQAGGVEGFLRSAGFFGSFDYLNPVAVADGARIPITFASSIDDPESLLQSGSYVSDFWGATFGPNQWLRLPVGEYRVLNYLGFAIGDPGNRWAGLDLIDDRVETPGIDSWNFDPGYFIYESSHTYRFNAGSGILIGAGETWVHVDWWHITPTMIAADGPHGDADLGIAMGLVATQDGAGTDVDLVTCSTQLSRIGRG